MIFLIEFNRESQELVTYKAYADDCSEQVSQDHLELERKRFAEGVESEIVVMQAANEVELKRTHGRYFSQLVSLDEDGIHDIAKSVAELKASSQTLIPRGQR